MKFSLIPLLIGSAAAFAPSARTSVATRLHSTTEKQQTYEEQLTAFVEEAEAKSKAAAHETDPAIQKLIDGAQPRASAVQVSRGDPMMEISSTPPVAVQEVESSGVQKAIYFGVAFLGLPLWLFISTLFFNVQPAGTNNQPSIPIPASLLSSTTAPSAAQPSGVVVLSQPITKAEVRALFTQWNDALHTLDPATVAKRYAKEGVLLPTLSDVPRTDFEGIKDYFVHFLEKKPDGKILEGEIFVGNNWAQDAGIYEFTFEDGSKVKARYSFVYVYEDGKWMISHHHSSLMPEEVVRPAKITKDEVRALFSLWNDALHTGSPETVAARYTKDAVLLPTLSDRARYTTDGIADYFVHFLEKKPDGRILEGNIKIGPNWAQDAGIYMFTFQDGSAVQGRYSFVYAYENGEWKISNHHSSIMPEGAVAAMKKVAAAEAKAPEASTEVKTPEAQAV